MSVCKRLEQHISAEIVTIIFTYFAESKLAKRVMDKKLFAPIVQKRKVGYTAKMYQTLRAIGKAALQGGCKF